MTYQKIEMTSQSLDELMTGVRNLPDKPVGDHLSDDDFIYYAMSDDRDYLTEGDIRRIDDHLASCPACVEEMKDQLDGVTGKTRLTDLRERLLEIVLKPYPSFLKKLKEALVEATQHIRECLEKQPQGAIAHASHNETNARSEPIWDWESKDRTLAGVAVREKNGDLTFHFLSKDLNLAGKNFILRIDSLVRRNYWRREPQQQRVEVQVVVRHNEKPSDLKNISFDVD